LINYYLYPVIKREKNYEALVVLKKLPTELLAKVDLKKDQSTKLMTFYSQAKRQEQKKEALVSLELPQRDIKWKVEAKLTPESSEQKLDMSIKVFVDAIN